MTFQTDRIGVAERHRMTSAPEDGGHNPTDKSQWLPRDPKGHRLIRVMRNLVLISILVNVVVAIYTVGHVPLDTTTSYTRRSKEYQIPIFVLLGMPTILALWWLRSRRAAFEPLPPNERALLFALAIPIMIIMVVSQFFLARSYLEAGSSLG
jgi:hypothetical protein